MASVLVLGHSFVRRLDDTLSGSWTNLGFDPDKVQITCVGKSGGRLRHMYARWISNIIQDVKPSVVLLQIGGNDLDRFDFDTVKDTIVTDLISIAEWLLAGFRVQQVGFMQLFYRQSTRSMPVHIYNEHVDFVNNALKQRCVGSTDYFYWRHKGLKDGVFEDLCRDGVHLSANGMRKYSYSVRGAALQGLRLAAAST
ncbi:uncharacterized protein LOC117336654 [Pecten maximus]|uniref:uncharacterized protein LOC117320400 n=1 Tax=Pecten maximus TaxID=6579 RepID=UPI0014580005|nr:uncharacterized protein LOC117320400 [Pecten maximus]XP_033753154.1 uncharacterized protein LOC117336654 [Pecten maximus]